MQGEEPRRYEPRRRWRVTLYARAVLFLVLGSGSLLGAAVVLSFVMVEESVHGLLGERIDLARTSGALLEQRMQSDLSRLADHLRPNLAGKSGGAKPDSLRKTLDQDYRSTLFQEGAFALDAAERMVASVPDALPHLAASVDLKALARRARRRGGAVNSSLIDMTAGPKVLVLLRPIERSDGRLIGYAGGLLQPAASDLLDALAPARMDARTQMDLVDADGVVVASTEPAGLFREGDHDEVLTQAVSERREFQGRCHSCHTGKDDELERDTDILAFAPLPTLDLGMAVYEPEGAALAPAFALRSKLLMLLGFVGIFVLFAGLSVRSVVRPVKRLTRAVRRLETDVASPALPSFGRDEIGELARAMERWRSQTVASLAEAERHRQALHDEVALTRHHLQTLNDVAEQSTLGGTVAQILALGLDRALSMLELSTGAIRAAFGDQRFLVQRGFSAEEASELLQRGEALVAEAGGLPEGSYRARLLPRHEEGAEPGETCIVAAHHALHGLRVACVLGGSRVHELVDERWLESLLHHIGMSTTNRLLHEQERERQVQQQEYLRRVLKAREDERTRIARDLHDTVAQDLAALRLEIERVNSRVGSVELGKRLRELERRAEQMIVTVRRILLDLRLSVLENMGFLPTLQWHLERLQREHGIRGALSLDCDELEMDYEMAVTLFRIFQECIQNVVQHAQAEQVFVTVATAPGRIELTVEDDGRGFDAAAVLAQPPDRVGRGLGLLGLQERARLLGGRVEISSRPGDGTTVFVTVPYAAPSEVGEEQDP